MRQIILDTETTGLEPGDGHRIIEIGAVELWQRQPTGRHFHHYLQPDREIDAGAIAVHGISNEFLEGKPRFAEVADDFLDYCRDAELIIHNAAFDVGFLNHELKLWRADAPRLESLCQITDTLALARRMHPGQRNNLDALCKRYDIDNQHRDLHGALLDAEILADVYLAMTGGQVSLRFSAEEQEGQGEGQAPVRRLAARDKPLSVVRASASELDAHQAFLERIEAKSGRRPWTTPV